MKLDNQNDIMQALEGIHSAPYPGFPNGAAIQPTNFDEYLATPLEGGVKHHTRKELEAGLEAYVKRSKKRSDQGVIRSGLAAIWKDAPDYIVGFAQGQMNVAQQLLDDGRRGAVNELLKNIDYPDRWTAKELSTAKALFNKMQKGVENLMK